MDSHRMAGENDYSPSRPGSGCPDWTMTHPTPWIFLMNWQVALGEILRSGRNFGALGRRPQSYFVGGDLSQCVSESQTGLGLVS